MSNHPPGDPGATSGYSGSPSVPTCFRHPNRESYLRCQRCDRYVCPDCSRAASVGVHCVECVRTGNRSMPAARTRFGGVVHGQTDVVTKILIGINVAVFVSYLALGDAFGQRLALIGGSGSNPIGVPSGVAGGEVWRLLTSAFFHIEVWHIGVNMFSLWILGRPLEQLLGQARFVGLYLTTAFAGSAVAYAFTSPLTWVFGASGAVFGLFGAVVVLLRRMRADMTWIGVVLLINVVLNVMFWRVLSWQGHLGGFVAGLVLGVTLAYAPREQRSTWQVAGYVAVLVAAVLLVVAQTLLR